MLDYRRRPDSFAMRAPSGSVPGIVPRMFTGGTIHRRDPVTLA
jgi:hypothetical protein